MIFFGYFTKGTPYEREVLVLLRSLDALRVRHDFIGIPDRGTWQKNTQAKAEIVCQFLDKYPEQRLCYLDVDAVLLSRPALFDSLDADVGCTLYGAEASLCGGTIFLQSNYRTKALAKRWVEINAQYPDRLPNGDAAWDQRTLEMAITEHVKCGLTFKELPQEYCYMIGNSQRQYPGLVPVILHSSAAMRWGTGSTCERFTPSP